MIRKITALIFLFLAPIAGAQEIESLSREAANFAKAMMQLDYRAIARQSHPSIVQASGGADAYAKLIQKSYTEADLRFHNMKFGKPADVRTYGDISLATIPYTATVTYGKEREQATSFYYAFSGPNRKAWFFMDCTNATDKLLGQLVKGYDSKIKKPSACQ